ncbi:permease [Filibacter tadaridae]|uniref:Putative permease n=1 Tax=Filibacter tadaridae TaxID=2483811 RepID=A0A3P5XBU9_9BACL|nr:permease [Filibacter tadaridae]VDC25947.1 putative permease [Filibacter tadaridae]
MNHSLQSRSSRSKRTIVYVLLFLLIAVAGLAYLKWVPYYSKSMLAVNTHSIGDSILGDPSGAGSFSWDAAWSYALVYFNSVWKAAVLGILLGSLLQVLLPANWLLRVLGKTSFGSTAIGGLSSLPGMMCTCCAAPVAVGMRKKNVSVGASLAFWLGNPTLNPATLIFITFVLSWKFTLLRLLFGIVLTFGVSYLANRFVPNAKQVDIDEIMKKTEVKETGSFMSRWMKSLGSMMLYIIPAYILSVLLMGAVRVWLFPHVSEVSANTIFTIILFAIAGMLFVIPTAAEIPIIQTFMSFGLGGGPAAALLITLPSISLPSLLLVARSFPKRVLFFVAGSVVLLGILSGVIGMYIL